MATSKGDVIIETSTMKRNYSRLINKRNALYARLQTIYNLSLKSSDDDVKTQEFLASCANIENMRTEFSTLLDSIIDYELQVNPECEPSYQAWSSFEDLYCRIVHLQRQLVSDINKSSPGTSQSVKTSTARLPPIELCSFNGEPNQWLVFFENFKSNVHENPNLTDSERVQYLVGKLSGKALSACAGLPPIAKNYHTIWDNLVLRYNDTRNLATTYLNQLLNLKSVPFGNSQNLDNFIENFSCAVSALKSLIPKNLDDFILVHLAMNKLDSVTIREFEMTHRSDKLPTYDSLVAFVREQSKILERSNNIVTPRVIKPDVKKASSYPRNTSGIVARPTQSYVTATGLTESKIKCDLCHFHHDFMHDCTMFNKMNAYERFMFIKKHSFCTNCLSVHHKYFNCESNILCKTCHLKHHSLLHYSKLNNKNISVQQHNIEPAARESDDSAPAQPVSCALVASAVASPIVARTTVILATALLNVIDKLGRVHTVRALLDNASQGNFVTFSLIKKLNLNIRSNKTLVKGIGSSYKTVKGVSSLTVRSRFDSKIEFNIDTLIVDRITEKLPTLAVDMSNMEYLQGLQLADEHFYNPGEIDLLVGATLFAEIIMSQKIKGPAIDYPVAIQTLFGFVVMGNAPIIAVNEVTSSFCTLTEPSIETLMERFWQIEEISADLCLSSENKHCENLFLSTLSRDDCGRYVVGLPFNRDPSLLGDSYSGAKRRFLTLERRLAASRDLRNSYNDIIKEYLEKGYLSLIDNPNFNDGYIIPHHCVVRHDKTTTKIRVVLDASMKTSTSLSLNDILHSGPNLQNDLFKIILNFRLFKFAFSADLKQMYLQIGVLENHRKYQRILFRFNQNEELKLYEFNRVTFGLRSSPYLAIRTVRQLAADEEHRYPLAAAAIRRDTYMDDVCSSVTSESEAIQTYDQLVNIFMSAGFEIVKWSSNSTKLLSHIPECHHHSQVMSFSEHPDLKVLGLQWSPVTDLFSYKINIIRDECTKRNILSTIARLWDIMGFVAPVIVYAKLIIRDLWMLKLDWDDCPPQHIVSKWRVFQAELPFLSELPIPRHLGVTRDSAITLLAFADASEKAYGAVVYMHVLNDQGPPIVKLVCAKSKVAPVRSVTIPRLELCAAVLMSKLVRFVLDVYTPRVHISDVFAFSDSTVALCWIHSSPQKWQTFVSNRVAKCQQNLPASCYYHIAGKNNPSDCLSRGLTPAQLLEHPLWINGPSWAYSSKENWPIVPFDAQHSSDIPEAKTVTLHVVKSCHDNNVLYELSQRCSSWNKLLHVIIYIYRFMHKLKCNKIITASDLEFAECIIIKIVQNIYFADDVDNVNADRLCTSKLRKLNPIIVAGILRVGGRLKNADLSFSQKHPIILPQRDHVTDLLISHYHQKHCHTGAHLLMSLLRQRYWILSARSVVRKIVQRCNFCFKVRPKATFPIMADLPACRVQRAHAFEHTATDYGGPIEIVLFRKRGVHRQKAYLCLFVCLVTRAVHIEVAPDLSTESFLSAFKRFISRRGSCAHLYSDNGTNFIGAKTYLKDLYKILISRNFMDSFSRELADSRIKWHLNPPAAPHFGGHYEIYIKAFKTHLRRVIGNQLLTYEELLTVLIQIEAVLNSRPLTLLSDDPDAPTALTPSHFLMSSPLTHLPAHDMSQEKPNLLRRFHLLDQMVQSFWRRWSTEYLHLLQSRQKWNTSTDPLRVGTVVLIRSDNTHPLQWPLGIVVEVYPGGDGVVRSASVKTQKGIYTRPVVRLCPLPSQ